MRALTTADLARHREAAAEAEARLADLLDEAESASDRGLAFNHSRIEEARRAVSAARSAAGMVPT